ncbi:PucR family transcriptional regulator [Actinomycetospora termitidis]|uniref:PucR family transcriptional regulator ligand-binding domain-containing protein n=1 Tax=Actinomycetospora termitidis TaxID=3053470 RepID=A0ABT7MAJ7_9PSEU|nr:PucR family transcriptional regulator [Actinomycetospora sp. Odt1-22]MDL5157681.1 PucR family transcriptional regulator ligand-binding domain-containing protein [Actinomycetospora sp. Odt1-22]
MLLAELVAHPRLGLAVLHGDDAALERSVRWVYTTDLIDPSRYLSGGELVISGLVWRRSPEDSERFVAAVAGAGAAALAAGAAVFGEVPDDVVEACRRHDLPLLSVPVPTSFSDVTELVVGALAAARGDRLALSLSRQRELLTAVAGGLGLDEVTARIATSTGRACHVVTATGRVVAGPPLPEPVLDAVVATFLTAPRLPAVGRRPVPYSVLPVGPASEARMTSWFVAVEGAHPEWDTETADGVGGLVAIAALDRARRGEGLRVAREIADEAIGLIADGAADRPETAVRLRQAGLDPDGTLVVAVAGFVEGDRDRTDLLEAARAVLVDAASHVTADDDPPVVGVREGVAVAVLPGEAGTVVPALRRLAPALGALRLTVGTSVPYGSAALSGAMQEARHARDLARTREGPLPVVTGAELTSHVALLAAVPDDMRRAFAARTLAPVLEHDERTGASLLDTLEAFLECSGSWSRVAARLHLHVNTVRYRIGRVEELTGRDLSRFVDRVDVFLALRSLG